VVHGTFRGEFASHACRGIQSNPESHGPNIWAGRLPAPKNYLRAPAAEAEQPSFTLRQSESTCPDSGTKGENMLWTVFVILLVLWLLGFGFHVAGSLIHILLVIALIVLVINLVSGRRTVV
jgi:Family of unknown function (DUF5670)